MKVLRTVDEGTLLSSLVYLPLRECGSERRVRETEWKGRGDFVGEKRDRVSTKENRIGL